MKDDYFEERLRSYFSAVEDDHVEARPMPRRGPDTARPHPAFRLALAAVAIAAVVAGLIISRSRVEPHERAPVSSGDVDPQAPDTNSTATTTPRATPSTADTEPPTIVTTSPTFPPPPSSALNYLIVGTDNLECDESTPPSTDTFADTIMVVRVDPATKRMSILSFPPDLWVKVYGTNTRSAIGSGFSENNPQSLISTIYTNFGIPINHVAQIDPCAFRTIIDAIGGVAVPFEHPARDELTGLDIPTAGCSILDGNQALAYVSSSHYTSLTEDGEWVEDPTGFRGRIARQQDFLGRVLDRALDRGEIDLASAERFISTFLATTVVDAGLTPEFMVQLAGLARDIDPTAITGGQIPADLQEHDGASVLVPNLSGREAESMLQIFMGETVNPDAAPVTTDGGTATPPPTVDAAPTWVVPPIATRC